MPGHTGDSEQADSHGQDSAAESRPTTVEVLRRDDPVIGRARYDFVLAGGAEGNLILVSPWVDNMVPMVLVNRLPEDVRATATSISGGIIFIESGRADVFGNRLIDFDEEKVVSAANELRDALGVEQVSLHRVTVISS